MRLPLLPLSIISTSSWAQNNAGFGGEKNARNNGLVSLSKLYIITFVLGTQEQLWQWAYKIETE